MELSPEARKEILDMMWAKDTDGLYEKYPCRCCCDVHTFSDCPARHWYGCKSGLPYGEEE